MDDDSKTHKDRASKIVHQSSTHRMTTVNVITTQSFRQIGRSIGRNSYGKTDGNAPKFP